MAEETYGIDKDNAHPRAIEIIPDEFFWDCGNELAPFGSDEGDMALAEWRTWRQENPNSPTLDCVIWTVESVGEMKFSDYNDSLTSHEKIKSQLIDSAFDDKQYIFTLDTSVIATAFGQLVDEGKIDKDVKPAVERAIKRLKIWSELQENWSNAREYIANLNILQQALRIA